MAAPAAEAHTLARVERECQGRLAGVGACTVSSGEYSALSSGREWVTSMRYKNLGRNLEVGAVATFYVVLNGLMMGLGSKDERLLVGFLFLTDVWFVARTFWPSKWSGQSDAERLNAPWPSVVRFLSLRVIQTFALAAIFHG